MNTRTRTSNFLHAVRALFDTGIHFMFELFVRPRSASEDGKRQEFILNTILCGIIPLLAVLDTFVGRAALQEGPSYRGIPFGIFTFIVGLFTYLLMLSRHGLHRLASYVLVILFFLGATYGAAQWGVELPLVAISYVLIIIISSILISTRFGFLVTGIIALSMTAISILQISHMLHPLLDWKYHGVQINDPIQLSVFFFLITVISWLSNREMERSLVRARASEKALIEERNLLEVKVEERTRELKDAQQEKVSQLYRFAEFGRISTSVFHDMMNSLQGIVSSVGQLDTAQSHLPEVQDNIRAAVAASRKMGGFISSVRRQIRSDDALRTVFLLDKEIADAIDMLQFQARQGNVTIALAPHESIEMHGNPVRFYQVMLNLLANAIDACESSAQGTVTVSLSRDETDSSATIVVSDTGCGIDSAILESIFDPFFTTKHPDRGTGFGLSETRLIIEKEFHGTIFATSSAERGSSFTIIIPLIPHDPSLPDSSPHPTMPPGRA